MTAGWIDTNIGEQITLQRGIDITKAEQRAGKFPVISSGGVSSYHDRPAASGPGVVLGRKGVVGSVYYVASDYWPHDTTLWVKDFHGNDPRFVYYFFKSMAARIATMDVGSANPTLNRNHVHPIKIFWPPIQEQRSIAHILGTLDDKIELNRRMNETLEAMARAIFKSWFVDFDPVRAKAEGRQPFGMDAATAALFPNSFQGSALGKNPKGWAVGKLDDLVEIIGGGTPKTSVPEFWDGDIPWYSVVDAPTASDAFVVDTKKKISKAGLDNCSATILPEKTTIISARGTVGKLALVGVPMAMNQSCYALRAIDGKCNFFTYFLMRDNTSDLSQSTHGTVFDTITRDTFKVIDAVAPSESVKLAFENAIRPLMERVLLNVKESRTLAAIRDALLPKLISGEIRVKDADTLVAQST